MNEIKIVCITKLDIKYTFPSNVGLHVTSKSQSNITMVYILLLQLKPPPFTVEGDVFGLLLHFKKLEK